MFKQHRKNERIVQEYTHHLDLLVLILCLCALSLLFLFFSFFFSVELFNLQTSWHFSPKYCLMHLLRMTFYYVTTIILSQLRKLVVNLNIPWIIDNNILLRCNIVPRHTQIFERCLIDVSLGLVGWFCLNQIEVNKLHWLTILYYKSSPSLFFLFYVTLASLNYSRMCIKFTI